MQLIIEEDDASKQIWALGEQIFKMVKSGAVSVEVKAVSENKARTIKQNNCIHKYCDQLSKAYNEAGLDKLVVLEQQLSVDWSMQGVKDDQWRSVQVAMGLPESTTKLAPKEVSAVYETLNRHTSTNFGIHVPWPSLESQRINSI